MHAARQLVTESVILSTLSAAAGLAVGYAALQLLGTLDLQDLPRGAEIRLDGTRFDARPFQQVLAGSSYSTFGGAPLYQVRQRE